MSNMSYCRFQNTVSDLRDCYENWTAYRGEDGDSPKNFDEDEVTDVISEDESYARERLYKLCKQIVDEFADHEGSNYTCDSCQRWMASTRKYDANMMLCCYCAEVQGETKEVE